MSAAHWTDETDAEADAFYATLTDAEIRRRQDLCSQQIRMAHERRNDRALADLRRMEDALARSMMARLVASMGEADRAAFLEYERSENGS